MTVFLSSDLVVVTSKHVCITSANSLTAISTLSKTPPLKDTLSEALKWQTYLSKAFPPSLELKSGPGNNTVTQNRSPCVHIELQVSIVLHRRFELARFDAVQRPCAELATSSVHTTTQRRTPPGILVMAPSGRGQGSPSGLQSVPTVPVWCCLMSAYEQTFDCQVALPPRHADQAGFCHCRSNSGASKGGLGFPK
ncbi:Hypothetical predicted protein [Scomber scombrus]|uniref:Uncharacterized protein n=1 Tax=Scomber scombrus TaxID=13677 RepID=A0AAV1PAL7_SCOSC